MALRRKALTAAYFPFNDAVDTQVTATSWTDSILWQYWRTIGELHFATTFLAKQVGRVRWDVTIGDERLKDERADEIIEELTLPRGPRHITEMLALNFQVPGRMWYLNQPTTGWEVVATTHPDVKKRKEAADIVVYGINPDPENPKNADSPVRANMLTIQELALLQQQQRAQARNRLVQRGILLYPNDVDFDSDFETDFKNSATAPIADEGSSASVVPHLIGFPSEFIEKWDWLIPEFPYDDALPTKIDAVTRRLAYGMNLPPEAMLGIGNLTHWCVDTETEVYTRRGWVREPELRIGDEVRSLDHSTGLSRWRRVADIYRADVVDEPMRFLDGVRHSSLTTLNHRWPVVSASGIRKWKTSQELVGGDRILTAAPSDELPTEAKFSDAFVELVAWFTTDGSVRHRMVTLHQSHTANPHKVARIVKALTETFGPERARLRGTSGPGWRRSITKPGDQLGGPVTRFHLNVEASSALIDKAPDRETSFDFIDQLTESQLRLFIEVCVLADGWHQRAGRIDIWKKRRSALDAFERALILSGHAVSEGRSGNGWWIATPEGTVARPVHAATETRRRGTDGATDETISYSGRVWCPVVEEDHSFLARRKGRTFFTGNSQWSVQETTYRAHIEPDASQVGFVLSKAAIKYFEEPIVKITPDPTPLLARVGSVTDALEMFDRGIVNAEFVRDRAGAQDDDKPGEAERLEQLDIGTRRPAVRRLSQDRQGPPVERTPR